MVHHDFNKWSAFSFCPHRSVIYRRSVHILLGQNTRQTHGGESLQSQKSSLYGFMQIWIRFSNTIKYQPPYSDRNAPFFYTVIQWWCKCKYHNYSLLDVYYLENTWWNVQQRNLFISLEKKPRISLVNLKQHPHLQTWAWALNNTWCVVHTWQGTTQSITGRDKYFISRLFGICSRMYSFPQKHLRGCCRDCCHRALL